jgi:hypothetical protein
MSRGPGIWQRTLLNVTDGGLAMTVRAVVMDSVTQPARSDYVSARRATRSLALAGRISAVYLHGCRGCGSPADVSGMAPPGPDRPGLASLSAGPGW